MEQSTTTLIQAINKVLENIGERQIISTQSPVGRKMITALTDGLHDFASEHDWSFLKDKIIANSWNNENADLGEIQRLHKVVYGDKSTGFIDIPWVDVGSFDSRPVTPMVGDGDTPLYHTYETYNTVRLQPYPTTPEQQSKFRFHVTREVVPPANVDDTFPVPERLMPLVIYKACTYACLSHLDDPQAANTWNIMYTNMLNRIKARETATTTSQLNMYHYRG